MLFGTFIKRTEKWIRGLFRCSVLALFTAADFTAVQSQMHLHAFFLIVHIFDASKRIALGWV